MLIEYNDQITINENTILKLKTMDSLSTAIMLMIVGMGTVFIILLFVIYFSKLIIIMVNKIAPEEINGDNNHPRADDIIPPRVMNIISQAVTKAAPGSKINNIKKL